MPSSVSSTNPVYFPLFSAMLKDLNTCRRCSQAQNCTTFHKAAEQGDSITSGLGKFFNEMTDHMTKSYVNYFTNWFKLVCLEGKEMEAKRTQQEIWCLEGWEREKLGRCFSGMVLKPCGHDAMIAGSRYCRHTFERAMDYPSETPLHDVPIAVGERVILSEECNGAIALAAGINRVLCVSPPIPISFLFRKLKYLHLSHPYRLYP